MATPEPTPRELLLESLLVERFGIYRPAPTQPPTAEEVARAIRLVVDNTEPRKATA